MTRSSTSESSGKSNGGLRLGVRRRNDSGQASLELIGLLPLLGFGGALVLQMGLAMWTITSTNEAARLAARTYSVSDSVAAARAAAEGSLPGRLAVADLTTTGPGHGVRLSVEIPKFLPIPLGAVTREVVMP